MAKNMKQKTLQVKNIKHVDTNKRRSGVQDFGDLVPEDVKTNFGSFAGRTIYIVKLEPKSSPNYGEGYVVSFKDFPNAAETMTTGVFGVIPAKQLDALWQATNEGHRISLDSPVATTIEEVPTSKGMSYKFAPVKKAL